jgi:hypothetical protein
MKERMGNGKWKMKKGKSLGGGEERMLTIETENCNTELTSRRARRVASQQ